MTCTQVLNAQTNVTQSNQSQTRNNDNMSSTLLNNQTNQISYPEPGIFGSSIANSPYRVTVTFDSITVLKDHDDDFVGYDRFGHQIRSPNSGEWYLYAVVQGQGIDLTKASRNELHDVDDGETVNFKPGTEITVDISKTRPVSILTWGLEDDGYVSLFGGFCFPYLGDMDAISSEILPVLKNPPSTWSDSLHEIQPTGDSECSNLIGFINKIYNPTDYGAGAHTNVVSSTGDFILRYTISVVPPPISGSVEPGIECHDNLTAIVASSSPSQSSIFGPTKAIDNNFSSYWMSTLSLNPNIVLDLGAQRPLCNIQIAWQDGDSKQYHFDVGLSKDGVSYTNVFSGTSSGISKASETYSLGGTEARYAKVTVTQSFPGSQNSQAKI